MARLGIEYKLSSFFLLYCIPLLSQGNYSKMVSSPLSLSLALLFLFLSSFLPTNAASNDSTTFTPEAMLSAPRRGSALPNSDGTLALYASTTWNFTTHTRTYDLSVMDLSNGSSWQFSNSSAVSNAQWLGDGTTILWLVSEDDGSTTFAISDATTPGAPIITAGSVPGAIDGLKTIEIESGTFALVFQGTAAPNGTLYNSELADSDPVSSGRMYTTVFVRHWDTCRSYLLVIRIQLAFLLT